METIKQICAKNSSKLIIWASLAGVYGAGEIGLQKLEHSFHLSPQHRKTTEQASAFSVRSLDCGRVAAMVFFGVFYCAPLTMWFYPWVDKFMHLHFPKVIRTLQLRRNNSFSRYERGRCGISPSKWRLNSQFFHQPPLWASLL